MSRLSNPSSVPLRWDDSATVRELLEASELPLAGLEHTQLWVLEIDRIVGVVGFERYGSAALLRSLAVVPEARERGNGASARHFCVTFSLTSRPKG